MDMIRATYDLLIAEEGPQRARDAAARLGISEAELVQSGSLGEAIRLAPRWLDLLQSLESAGRLMALSRNEACVHERKGTYTDVSGGGGHLLVVGPDIDLRGFPSEWAAAWYLTVDSHRGTQRSIQIFDAHGCAVHKVYCTDGTDTASFETLREAFRGTLPPFQASAPKKARIDRPDADVDAHGLRQAWLALRDTHDFFPMLRSYSVGRLQALRLAGEDLAQPVSVGHVRTMLTSAAERQIPIMCFVGNNGTIQIHTGTVHRIVEQGAWLNVMDPDFNLHLRMDLVTSLWCVVKPTEDGPVHSMEAYDADGNLVVQFFGARKPGMAERDDWRQLWSECTTHHIEVAS